MAKTRKNTTIKSNWFFDIVKGKFLVDDSSLKNWRFVLFLVILAFLSITSSHLVDKKVMRINDLENHVEDLKSQYTDVHRELMERQLQSEIVKKSDSLGLILPESQPFVIEEK